MTVPPDQRPHPAAAARSGSGVRATRAAAAGERLRTAGRREGPMNALSRAALALPLLAPAVADPLPAATLARPGREPAGAGLPGPAERLPVRTGPRGQRGREGGCTPGAGGRKKQRRRANERVRSPRSL